MGHSKKEKEKAEEEGERKGEGEEECSGSVHGGVHVHVVFHLLCLHFPSTFLEHFYGRSLTLADREMVEQHADILLKDAKEEDVAFLVVGDPFAATTHHDLLLRAAALSIPYRIIHNASIMNAVATCGLQLYQFGQSVSIPFFNDTWRPDSFYDKIKVNRNCQFHTMCLLDIKVKEQTPENLAKGIKVYEPPRYMSIKQAIEQLLEIEEKRKEGVYSPDSPAFGLARIGQDSQQIVSGTLSELTRIDFGGPLHTLVIPGDMHYIECDMFEHYHWNHTQRAIERQQRAIEEEKKREQDAQMRREENRRIEREAKERFELQRKQQQQATKKQSTNPKPEQVDQHVEEEEEVAALTDDLSLF